MDIVLTNGRLFDGNDVIDCATVIVRDGKILAVIDTEDKKHAKLKELTHLQDRKCYDLQGQTIIPGFIDSHVHVDLHGMANTYDENLVEDKLRAIRAAQEMHQTLKSGITTVRSVGSVNWIDLSVKEAIEQGFLEGPRMLTSGKILCITAPGSEYFDGLYQEVNGYDAFKEAAREQLKKGADLLKIMATGAIMNPGGVAGAEQPDIEEIRAVVEEAEKLNKHVAAHAHGAQGIKNAIEAGVHTIEHGTFADEASHQMMIDHGVYLVPTLSPDYFMSEKGEEGGVAPFMVEKLKHKKETRKKNLKKAIARGVKVAIGSDAGTPYNYHGNNAREMWLMVEEGMMTPKEAIESGTRVSAEACGLDNKLGTLEAGKVADLLVINGDPLQDINLILDSKHMSMIMKDGAFVKDAETLVAEPARKAQ